MDRKNCVLFYSSNSQASTNLLAYIKNLPIDFPTLVGMALVSVDSGPVRQVLLNNNVTNVPVLLVEYFSTTGTVPNKQQFVGQLIYKWIDEIVMSVVNNGQTPSTINNTTQKRVKFLQPITNNIPDITSLTGQRPVAIEDRTTISDRNIGSEANCEAVDISSEPDPSAGYKMTSRNKDIATIAAEMVKLREQEDEKINKNRKEGFPYNNVNI